MQPKTEAEWNKLWNSDQDQILVFDYQYQLSWLLMHDPRLAALENLLISTEYSGVAQAFLVDLDETYNRVNMRMAPPITQVLQVSIPEVDNFLAAFRLITEDPGTQTIVSGDERRFWYVESPEIANSLHGLYAHLGSEQASNGFGS